MKTAIATVSISGTLTEKLKAISAAGFDGIEIFEQDFIAHDGSPRDVGRMIRDHGLEIPLFQPFRDFECLPEPMRSKAFDRAERKFDVMQELGTDLVLICSSVHPAALGGIDRAAADLAELGENARELILCADDMPAQLARTIETRKPSVLAMHLYSLANRMNQFYTANKVLAEDVSPAEAAARLGLLKMAEGQLAMGLKVLGIPVPERM